MDEKNVLIVKMLGDFVMSWNGTQISGGVKARDSQFTRLMQILLHNRRAGVERKKLEELLFDESNSDDIHHMFRSVIYNTRKRLAKAGLPEVDYIRLEGGRYYWTDEIEVLEDADIFETKCMTALEETDPELKARLLTDACLYYDGEFLPNQTSLVWVIREDRRYRELFCSAMDHVVLLLRDSGDYQTMAELGRHATAINPLAEWEFVTMEALVSMEKYDEARALYEDTVDYYMQELGTKPSSDAADLLDKLGGSIGYRFGMIDEIQMELSGRSDANGGGYVCTYPVFRGIYRMIERMLDRGGQSVYLMLCTLVDGDGRPMKDGAVLTRLADKLGDAIFRSVRHSDVICRYGKGQYLVLLINTTIENCGVVEQRINKLFGAASQRNGVTYHVSVVTYEPF